MAKINKQNPLKTFNDNYAAKAKKVVEGNNKLVKAQVGKIVKPVKTNNTKVDSAKYYYDKAINFSNAKQKVEETAEKEGRWKPFNKDEGWKDINDKDRKKIIALNDSTQKYFSKMINREKKDRAEGKPHWAMPADTTAKKMGGSSSYKKGGQTKSKKK